MLNMSRLTVIQKLTLLGTMALGALLIPSGLYTQRLLAEWHVTARSASSEKVFAHLLGALRSVQTSRGLAAGGLAGNEGMMAKLKDAQAKAQAELSQLPNELAATDGSPSNTDAATQLASRFQGLSASVQTKQINGAQSFAQHTALINELLALMDLIMDDYGLSLEPNADLYFLMQGSLVHMPWLTEYLGQMRGMGNGMLVSQTFTEERKMRLSVMMDAAKQSWDRGALQSGKALPQNALFSAKLSQPLNDASKATSAALGLVSKDILQTDKPTLSAEAYFTQTTQSIDAVYDFIQAASDEIDRQLHANLDANFRHLMLASLALVGLVGAMLVMAVATTRSIAGPLKQAMTVANAVAGGDLTQRVQTSGTNETAQLLQALARMQEGLSRVVSTVRTNADLVARASSSIAHGADDLARRTESQASSLEETAASMEELGATVSQNAEHIEQASQSAASATAVANRAGEAVAGFVTTMQAIHQSSAKIGDIISVIDGIAFQTNILALNAAVEAARAGEAGRGFAVVASEVRSLAQRSAEAAKEIKGLITESVSQVESGTLEVERARLAVAEVVDEIAQVSSMMGQVNLASQEQRAGLGQVTQAVADMDKVTQQNAALVEESATSASEMQARAAQLQEAVSFFRV